MVQQPDYKDLQKRIESLQKEVTRHRIREDEFWRIQERLGIWRPRRAIVAHCISAEARFHPTNVGYIYGRYKRFGDTAMDDSFFPILWTRNGGRSAFLADDTNGG